VTTYHGNAREFLQRDCQNIANFFASQGVDVTADDDPTSLSPPTGRRRRRRDDGDDAEDVNSRDEE